MRKGAGCSVVSALSVSDRAVYTLHSKNLMKGSLDVLVIALCLLCGLGDAYRHGDPVNALKRSQYKGYRTEWSAMPSEVRWARGRVPG